MNSNGLRTSAASHSDRDSRRLNAEFMELAKNAEDIQGNLNLLISEIYLAAKDRKAPMANEALKAPIGARGSSAIRTNVLCDPSRPNLLN